MCAVGVLLALIERGRSGRGQIVDTDMASPFFRQEGYIGSLISVYQVTGARFISTFPLLHSMLPTSRILGKGKPGTNTLDGGAPFYNVYECKGGGFMAVGCLEPQFFRAFIIGFKAALPTDFEFQNDWRPTPDMQADTKKWPTMRAYFEKGFLTNTREYWSKIFHGMRPSSVTAASSYILATFRNGCVCSSRAYTKGSCRGARLSFP